MRTNVTRQFRSGNETSTRSFPGTNIHCGRFVPGTKVHGNETSRYRTVERLSVARIQKTPLGDFESRAVFSQTHVMQCACV